MWSPSPVPVIQIFSRIHNPGENNNKIRRKVGKENTMYFDINSICSGAMSGFNSAMAGFNNRASQNIRRTFELRQRLNDAKEQINSLADQFSLTRDAVKRSELSFAAWKIFNDLPWLDLSDNTDYRALKRTVDWMNR